MRKLVIGFSKSTKKLPLFSWAIRLWDGTEYSHCYTQFENRRHPELPLIYQASHDMMNFMSRQVFESNNAVIEEFTIEITDEAYDHLMYKAIQLVGKPYGVKQILGIAVARVLNLKTNPFHTRQDTYTCSEWCGMVLKELGYVLPKDPNLITPKDVYKVLRWTKS
jgi:hypothetical protein